MTQVTVIDYGLGNLFSVARAFEKSGATVHLTSSATEVESAERLVIPGVGAFADGMLGLRGRNLIEAILKFASSERPILGICLGMQILFERGLEFGDYEGLGLLQGAVKQIPTAVINGELQKIPHIGWNSIWNSNSLLWERSLLDGLSEGDFFYFVHSFAPDPTDNSCRFANTRYAGQSLPAVVRKGNIYGCQFHPEKSGPSGLRILKNFTTL